MSEDVSGAFAAALQKDAGAAEPPEIPAPPRKPERDPDAPHGRTEDGTPLAPYGHKPDGVPRLRPAGPGRPRGEDKPRVTTVTQTANTGKGGGGTAGKSIDYAPGLMATGEMLWLGLSLNHGMALGKRKDKDGTVKPLVSIPDTRPYAVVFKQQLPLLAHTWSEAANQNETVRRYVSKFAGGEGEGVSWVLGVGLSSAMFAMGCAQLAKKENEALRAQLAEKNDGDVAQYFQSMLEKMGLGE